MSPDIQSAMSSDKNVERDRYDERSRKLLMSSAENGLVDSSQGGACDIPIPIRAPYLAYEQIFDSCLSPSTMVCEIGAGIGAFTSVLLRTGATVYATDISRCSLDVLARTHESLGRLETTVADMESLPFPDEFFDLIASAGSLSYGDNQLVQNEIFRVLKRGGVFVCVDSLNHNPIYKFNRWLHYLRGNRTLSTLLRMPTITLIDSYAKRFGFANVRYFGVASWLMPLIVRLFGEISAARFSDWADRSISVRRAAFKFVMIAKKANDG